jgi:hypothetical protein
MVISRQAGMLLLFYMIPRCDSPYILSFLSDSLFQLVNTALRICDWICPRTRQGDQYCIAFP